jgi:O-acetylhomoserine (thiol)-lyase
MSDKKKLGFDTLQLHAGQYLDPQHRARAVPIYQTTSYVYKDFENAVKLSTVEEFGFTYTRLVNPTTDVLEQRIAALEGGSAAVALGSGSAASSYAILNLAGTGDEIVSASTLYGGTYNLFANTLPRYGITTKFVDPDESENFRKAIGPKTKAIFIESIGNPGINIVDFDAVGAIAKAAGIPLIVDNTFATPYLFRPFEHGANVVVHSATKFIGGHGTTIGGLLVDGGNFDWSASGKFPGFTEVDRSYGFSHWERFKDWGGANIAFAVKARLQLLRDIGAALSPQNSFLLLQGLETLSLRIRQHVANAQVLAEYLEKHPQVEWIDYPGLPSNKYHALAKKYLPKGPGAIFTFGIKGGYKAARKFIESLEIFSFLANVGDAKSLVVHPATVTHGQLSEAEQRAAGVKPEQIRLSVGIEDVEDLKADLAQAFDKVK